MKNLLYILTLIITTTAIPQTTHVIALQKQQLKQASNNIVIKWNIQWCTGGNSE